MAHSRILPISSAKIAVIKPDNVADILREVRRTERECLTALRRETRRPSWFWRNPPTCPPEPVPPDWLLILLSDKGEDVAEYSIMLVVIIVIVVGTIRMIGSNATQTFSQVGSQIR